MTLDIRINATLPAHPKTKKLIRRVGMGGAWQLVCFFLWARQNRSDGDLSGMSDEDIELAVDWDGEPGAFVAALIDVKFLDGAEGARSIHDWADHNPWSTGAEERSDKSRKAAFVKHYGKDRGEQMFHAERARRKGRACNGDAPSMPDACNEQEINAPSMPLAESGSAPSPLPSPSPKDTSADALESPATPGTPACPHAEIVALYHELLPELPVMRSWPEDRQALLRTRWREDQDRQSLAWWREFFEYVRRCPFLLGQEASGHREPFLADLEWLVRPKNFRKVVEGKYEARKAA